MLYWLRTNATTAIQEARKCLKDELSRYKNKDLMQAIVAGCAAMAFADKNVSSAEKQKMYGYLQNSEELKVFKLEEVLAFFNQAVAKFEFDLDIGLAEALKVIGKVKVDDGAARLLVRVCITIGASDGNFDDAEKKIARKIAKELGLNPAEFGL